MSKSFWVNKAKERYPVNEEFLIASGGPLPEEEEPLPEPLAAQADPTLRQLYRDQKAGLDQNDALIRMQAQAIKPQMDLSGLAALIDSQTGSNLSSSYRKPATLSEKMAPIMAQAEKNQDNRRDMLKTMVFDKASARKAKEASEQKGSAQEIRINSIFGQAIRSMNNDPVIKPSEQNLASLGKASALLNNPAVPITPQTLADAEQDIAAALALRGIGATEGKIKRTELHTMARKIAELKQFYLNQPNIDLRKEQPELVDQIRNLNSALMDDYKVTIKQRKNSILDQYEDGFGSEPRFQQRVSAMRNRVESDPLLQANEEHSPKQKPALSEVEKKKARLQELLKKEAAAAGKKE